MHDRTHGRCAYCERVGCRGAPRGRGGRCGNAGSTRGPCRPRAAAAAPTTRHSAAVCGACVRARTCVCVWRDTTVLQPSPRPVRSQRRARRRDARRTTYVYIGLKSCIAGNANAAMLSIRGHARSSRPRLSGMRRCGGGDGAAGVSGAPRPEPHSFCRRAFGLLAPRARAVGSATAAVTLVQWQCTPTVQSLSARNVCGSASSEPLTLWLSHHRDATASAQDVARNVEQHGPVPWCSTFDSRRKGHWPLPVAPSPACRLTSAALARPGPH